MDRREKSELREMMRRVVREEIAYLIRRPTLLSYADAARQMGLRPTQFKARYVRTKRVRVVKDGGHPRVPASEIGRIESEMGELSSPRGDGVKRTRGRRAAPKRYDAKAEAAKLEAALKRKSASPARKKGRRRR